MDDGFYPLSAEEVNFKVSFFKKNYFIDSLDETI